MKSIHSSICRIVLIALSILPVTSAVSPSLACADCTEAEATAKMIASGRFTGAVTEMVNRLPNGEKKRQLHEATTPFVLQASEIGAEKDITKTCAAYDSVVTNLERITGLSSKRYFQGNLSSDQLATDGGKGAGECDLSTASLSYAKALEQVLALEKAGRLSPATRDKFLYETADFGDLIVQNPSAVCKRLREMAPKYKFALQ